MLTSNTQVPRCLRSKMQQSRSLVGDLGQGRWSQKDPGESPWAWPGARWGLRAGRLTEEPTSKSISALRGRKHESGKSHNINTNYKKALIPVLVSGRINFKTKDITKDKKGHVIMKTQQLQVHMSQNNSLDIITNGHS